MPQDVEQVKSTAFWSSLALVGLLLALVLLGPGTYDIAPKSLIKEPEQRFGVFLLDRNTDTYSLSTLQFYLWTGAAVFAYAYLTVARILCQGVLELADIPENLPGILAISASATVLSVQITKQKGPKGAGEAHPSLKDLISAGGLVQPERVQLLVWTLVAIGSFLLAVLRSDPTSMSNLPGIPERLLWLSGVSTFGYLGGKMVRRAGPVIDDVRVSADKSVLKVLGQELDVAATFEIDKTPLAPYLSPTPGQAVQAVTPSGATESATELHLTLIKRESAWLVPGNPVELTIINRDGQRATWPFMFEPPPKPTEPA